MSKNYPRYTTVRCINASVWEPISGKIRDRGVQGCKIECIFPVLNRTPVQINQPCVCVCVREYIERCVHIWERYVRGRFCWWCESSRVVQPLLQHSGSNSMEREKGAVDPHPRWLYRGRNRPSEVAYTSYICVRICTCVRAMCIRGAAAQPANSTRSVNFN